nr:hypothetical protein EUGRSUZ_G03337 [Ipomoea batatas]
MCQNSSIYVGSLHINYSLEGSCGRIEDLEAEEVMLPKTFHSFFEADFEGRETNAQGFRPFPGDLIGCDEWQLLFSSEFQTTSSRNRKRREKLVYNVESHMRLPLPRSWKVHTIALNENSSRSENQVSSIITSGLTGFPVTIIVAIEDVITTRLTEDAFAHDLRTLSVPFNAGSTSSS